MNHRRPGGEPGHRVPSPATAKTAQGQTIADKIIYYDRPSGTVPGMNVAQHSDKCATNAGACTSAVGRFVFCELGEVLRGRYRHERLAVPTLFIHGKADRAVRPEILRGYEPYADDLRVQLLPGAGHFVCDAEPELVAARMTEFLAGDFTQAEHDPPSMTGVMS